MQSKTISIFLDLLSALASQESTLEYSRQTLAAHQDFEPYSLFLRLDSRSKGFLVVEDILNFLENNSLASSLKSCELLLKQFDYDRDGSWVFAEFLRLVLPTDSPVLRTAVSQRPVNKKLNFDIEFAASRLMSKEIEGLLVLETLKKDLFFNFFDFDLKEAFFLIDHKNKGFLAYDSLEDFAQKHGKYLSPANLVNLLKRLDRNDDGKVSFEEFRDALLPLNGSLTGNLKDKDQPPVFSPNRHYEEDFYEKYEEKPNELKSNIFLKSQLPSQTLNKSKMHLKETSSPTQIVNHSHYCRKHAKPKQDPTQHFFKEQGELARTLKQLVSLDRELELSKKELCFREDFDPKASFEVFDFKGKGLLTAGDLETGLKTLGLFPSKYEIFLFVKRYDKDQDGKISFGDFIESMVPGELWEVVRRRRSMENTSEFEQVNWLICLIINIFLEVFTKADT